MLKKMQTQFKFGFSLKGKRRSDVGDDLIGIYKAPSGWSDVYSGTPIQVDTGNAGYLKVCPDGEKPEGLLFSRVSDELTDLEWAYNTVERDEVQAGNPVTYVVGKEGAILDTKLLADGWTPSAGEKVYVSSGKFDNTDPLSGDGVCVGEVKAYDSDSGYATISLEIDISSDDILRKINDSDLLTKLDTAGLLKRKEIDITAPADGTEQDTGESLPEGAIVHGVYLNVTTAESTGTTKTLDVGTDSAGSGDADGFLVGVDVSTTGTIKGTLANAGQTKGALLSVISDATNSVRVPEEFIYGTDNITFTAGDTDWAEFEGTIAVVYSVL